MWEVAAGKSVGMPHSSQRYSCTQTGATTYPTATPAQSSSQVEGGLKQASGANETIVCATSEKDGDVMSVRVRMPVAQIRLGMYVTLYESVTSMGFPLHGVKKGMVEGGALDQAKDAQSKVCNFDFHQANLRNQVYLVGR